MNQNKYDKFIDDVNCINNPHLRRRLIDIVDSLLEEINNEITDCIELLSVDGRNSKAIVKSKLQKLISLESEAK